MVVQPKDGIKGVKILVTVDEKRRRDRSLANASSQLTAIEKLESQDICIIRFFGAVGRRINTASYAEMASEIGGCRSKTSDVVSIFSCVAKVASRSLESSEVGEWSYPSQLHIKHERTSDEE